MRPALLLFPILLLLVLTSQASGQAPQPAVEEMNAKKALEGMPRDVLRELKEPTAGFAAAIEKASQFVKGKIDKKTAVVSFKIKTIEQLNHVTIVSTEDEERVSGTPFIVEYTLMLDDSQKALAAKFKTGGKVRATCEVYGGVSRHYSKPKLVIECYKPVFN